MREFFLGRERERIEKSSIGSEDEKETEMFQTRARSFFSSRARLYRFDRALAARTTRSRSNIQIRNLFSFTLTF
jgi:hypothetical protein